MARCQLEECSCRAVARCLKPVRIGQVLFLRDRAALQACGLPFAVQKFFPAPPLRIRLPHRRWGKPRLPARGLLGLLAVGCRYGRIFYITIRFSMWHSGCRGIGPLHGVLFALFWLLCGSGSRSALQLLRFTLGHTSSLRAPPAFLHDRIQPRGTYSAAPNAAHRPLPWTLSLPHPDRFRSAAPLFLPYRVCRWMKYSFRAAYAPVRGASPA